MTQIEWIEFCFKFMASAVVLILVIYGLLYLGWLIGRIVRRLFRPDRLYNGQSKRTPVIGSAVGMDAPPWQAIPGKLRQVPGTPGSQFWKPRRSLDWERRAREADEREIEEAITNMEDDEQ